MLADAAHTSPVRGRAGTGVTTETQATALTNEREAVLSCMTKLMDPPPDGEGRRFCRCHCIGRRARSPGPCSALPGPTAAGRDLSRPPGPQGSPREESAPASWVLPERPSLPAVLALPWQQSVKRSAGTWRGVTALMLQDPDGVRV